MRLACVSIPRFPCALEVQRHPLWSNRPPIVGDADLPKRVLECSDEAAATGVDSGLPIRKALALCPDALVVPPDPVVYRERWEEILDALGQLSPQVEDAGWGLAYLNMSGLAAHYCDEEAMCRHILECVTGTSGLDASVGLASSKFTAFAAALSAPPGSLSIVRAGAEASFLAPLPVKLLPVEAEFVSRLHLFGLTQIREVAALSDLDLQTQFGFDGRRIWQLVNGVDEDRLRPRDPVESLVERVSFEAPVAGIDVMVAVARQLLSRLRSSLRGRAARELTLQAELDTERGWERRLVFREAVSEDTRLFFVVRASLESSPPPTAIRSLALRLGVLAGESGKQLSLGERGRLQLQVEETIRQLKTRYGHSPIYRCVDVEPWSAIPEDRQILVESDV